MWDKFIDFLEKWPMTVLGGVCLAADLLLPIDLPLSIVTVAICGLPLVYSAMRRLLFERGLRRISSALLITAAMVAAVVIGDVFAAGEVAFIMALGELLEDATTDRAKRGLHRLMALAPATARRVSDEGEETIAASDIAVGDVLRVLPGETIPADGVVTAGESAVDQSVMTGESLPVDRVAGDAVYCGTVNGFGAMDIRVTKVGEDSSLSQIIRLMEQAENKQASVQRIADRWASILVPAALVIAVLGGLITHSLVTAVTVLVVFCPCALVLATPTAIMAAVGQATAHGVVIKSGAALETMGYVDTITLDKTGTLTHGRLTVSDVFPQAGEAASLLRLAASAESRSEHPLARAIVAAADGMTLLPVTDFTMQAGRGVSASVGDSRVLCGSMAYLQEHGVAVDEDVSAPLAAQGKACVFVAADGAYRGLIALTDTVREDAARAVSALQARGARVVLLTGDDPRAAAYVAQQVGIDEVHAALLPQDKAAAIEAMQRDGKRVCMIGDGINDAPALKTADVGVAMGGIGSDITVEAADIALMGDDLTKLPYLQWLAAVTGRTIRGGITLSMVINVAAVGLSLLQVLTPTTGALVHNAGSVLVVLLAALLYDRRYR